MRRGEYMIGVVVVCDPRVKGDVVASIFEVIGLEALA
jgi:hypothetical protein